MSYASRGEPLSPNRSGPVPFGSTEREGSGYRHGYQSATLGSQPTWSAAPDQQTHRRELGVNVLLTLERPPAACLAGLDRGERYRMLMTHACEQRQRIAEWAEEEGLCNEIIRLGEPNSFHLLFVYCTPHAARQLVRAPGVTDVAIAQAA